MKKAPKKAPKRVAKKAVKKAVPAKMIVTYASKEAVKHARTTLRSLVNAYEQYSSLSKLQEQHVRRVEAFLDAAEKRLPLEETYIATAARRAEAKKKRAERAAQDKAAGKTPIPEPSEPQPSEPQPKMQVDSIERLPGWDVDLSGLPDPFKATPEDVAQSDPEPINDNLAAADDTNRQGEHAHGDA